MFLLVIKIICKNVTNKLKLSKWVLKNSKYLRIVSLKRYEDNLNNIINNIINKLNYKLNKFSYNFHKLYTGYYILY